MNSRCKRCALLVDEQVFEDGDLRYDIAKARAIVEVNRRDPVEIPAGKAYEAVKDSVQREHSKHVDIKYPAIVIRHKGQFVFIDGNHRTFKRLCRLLPVKAYILTAREKKVILSRK